MSGIRLDGRIGGRCMAAPERDPEVPVKSGEWRVAMPALFGVPES